MKHWRGVQNIVCDPNVEINVVPGRRGIRWDALRLGPHARLRSGTVLYAHSVIGRHFETGHHVVIREENTIGDHVSIWNNSTIDYGCRIGRRVKIHCNCYIAQYSVLEDDVFVAPGVIFANDRFPGTPHAARVLQGPILKRGAQVGVNCTILPGVTIGAGAVIGAGSVVTRDVPDGAVAWGNPARARKDRETLVWPENFRLIRKDAAAYYGRKLSNRRAYANQR
ncbi:MAG TPA: acyltransferase [Elusimicrobiota bacterium]|nr:acyltransferase [Elusimicrobiota bacterium]